MVYSPAEDSFFLVKCIKDYLNSNKIDNNSKILDLGTGSGFISEELINLGFKKRNILASDINENAIKQVKEKGFNVLLSNLFDKIKGKFEIIVFNPPYLPESHHDKKKDTTGGKKGDETIVKFLQNVKKHLEKKGVIFLLLSSKTPRKRIEKEMNKQNLNKENIGEKRLFFEKLEVWAIKIS